ncbi:MAG: hypothetical protein MZU91_05850 [Desulfosudis oleivorans]|nr:hypothetical protein [Desulfosudis oleivorans]
MKFMLLLREFLKEKNLYDELKYCYFISKMSIFIHYNEYLSNDNVKKEYFLNLQETVNDLEINDLCGFGKINILTALLIKSGNFDTWQEFHNYLSFNKNVPVMNIDVDVMQYKDKFKQSLEQNKDKKICLYGAGSFAKEVLADKAFHNIPNIIGILDKNESLKGSKIGGYEIYTPHEIADLKPDLLIPSVLSGYRFEGFFDQLKYFYNLKFDVIYL